MSATGSTPVLTKHAGTSTGSGGPGDGRVRRAMDSAGTPLRGLAGLAGLVVLLEVLPHTGLVSADYLPPASEMGRALWQLLGEDVFWTALGDTLTGWGLGLVQYNGVMSTPPSLAPTWMAMDVAGVFNVSMISVVLAFLFAGFTALCVGLLRVFTRRGFTTPGSAARTLELPVLAVAPMKTR